MRLRHLLVITSVFSAATIPAAWANPEESAATTVTEWMAQIEASQAQITGVRLDTTEAGFQVVLETATELVTPTKKVSGNILEMEIPNAVLMLPEGSVFQEIDPIEGITQVQVTQLPDNRVQVTIAGTEAAPTAEVLPGATGLTLSVVPGVVPVSEDAELEVTVTAERGEADYNPTNSSTATGTDTPLRDVPLSVQVIPKEVLEDRNVTELGDALETAGGVVPAGRRGTSVFGPNFLIRGFPVSRGFFRDGVTTFSLSSINQRH